MLLEGVISPYHLTTREPAAMAALLLADRVATALPAPEEGASRESIGRAVELAPRYLRLMESWRWTMPLWRAGVLSGEIGGAPLASAAREELSRLCAEDRAASLRPMLRRAVLGTDAKYLDALAGDILKGGPDPAFTIPVAAALDRVAAGTGWVVFRGETASVAQKAEMRLAEPVFRVAIPVLIEAGGTRLLDARRRLRGALDALRAALGASFASEREPDASSRLGDAVAGYAAAFADASDELTAPDEEDGGRAVGAWVSLAGVTMPGDAALRASLAAARSMVSPSKEAPGVAPPPTITAPPRVLAIVVKRLKIAPAGARGNG